MVTAAAAIEAAPHDVSVGAGAGAPVNANVDDGHGAMDEASAVAISHAAAAVISNTVAVAAAAMDNNDSGVDNGAPMDLHEHEIKQEEGLDESGLPRIKICMVCGVDTASFHLNYGAA